MTNDRFTEKISLWLDNQLSPAEVTELKQHLADCSTCRQTYEAMQGLDRLFRTAATQMVTPAAGFTQRFEMHLARHRPVKPWQIWLALSALLGGTVFLFGAWAIVGGVALLAVQSTVLDVGLYYQGLVVVIEFTQNLQTMLNLGSLFLKASFITMGQPLFWGCVLIVISMTLLWVRIMRTLSRGATPDIQLIL